MSRECGLDGLPWDDVTLQEIEVTRRFYHFLGSVAQVTLEALPTGITPATAKPWDRMPGGVKRVWLVRAGSRVQVDGLGRAGRMQRHEERVQAGCDRINAELKKPQRGTVHHRIETRTTPTSRT